ncbi:hypothetical protein [Streptomyces sp. NPDC060322]|uniref:hypothetical protein n=1 Tax=Streptomyces sp. NPDC060322 TaxID=3347097 RepID=UPI003648FC1E
MTRPVLFGAPIAIAASILFSGGDSEPPTIVRQATGAEKTGTAEPRPAAQADEHAEEIDALRVGR